MEDTVAVVTERVVSWYTFWPIIIILLAMIVGNWLLRKGEAAEQRLRDEGRLGDDDW